MADTTEIDDAIQALNEEINLLVRGRDALQGLRAVAEMGAVQPKPLRDAIEKVTSDESVSAALKTRKGRKQRDEKRGGTP